MTDIRRLVGQIVDACVELKPVVDVIGKAKVVLLEFLVPDIFGVHEVRIGRQLLGRVAACLAEIVERIIGREPLELPDEVQRSAPARVVRFENIVIHISADRRHLGFLVEIAADKADGEGAQIARWSEGIANGEIGARRSDRCDVLRPDIEADPPLDIVAIAQDEAGARVAEDVLAEHIVDRWLIDAQFGELGSRRCVDRILDLDVVPVERQRQPWNEARLEDDARSPGLGRFFRQVGIATGRAAP